MKKRMLSLFLALTLCLSFLPTTAMAAEGDGGTEELAAIQLGTGGLQSPTGTEAETGKIDYMPNSYVYFGMSEGTPIKWRVLDAARTSDENEGVFLLSEYLLANDVQFNSDISNNAWNGSGAQAWCADFAEAAFSKAECDAIAATTKTEAREWIFGSQSAGGMLFMQNTLTAEKVFFLSVKEAESYLGNHQYSTQMIARDADGNAAEWWFRSPYFGDQPGETMVGTFRADNASAPSFVTAQPVTEKQAARPAFNLDASSVLFVSPAQYRRAPGLETVDTYSGNEWKLTFKDSAHSAFTAQTTGAEDNGLVFSYKNAQLGENERLSAIVTDADGNVTHYGCIQSVIAEPDSIQYVAFPEGFNKETDKIYIFNEQDNGDYKTNYASDFAELSLTPAPSGDVSFTSISAVGDGRDNWLHGAAWNPAEPSNCMTETTAGSKVYEITYTGIKAGKYSVRFIADNEWTYSWGVGNDAEEVPLSGVAVLNGENIEFTVDADNSTVKLVFDLSKFDSKTKEGAGYSVTITTSELPKLSPVYVGGVQLMTDTKYVNDGASVKVSADGSCNAIVTGGDADGYTLTIKGLNVTGKTDNGNFSYKSSSIYTETSKLTIVVEEDSTVTGAETSANVAGVYASRDLTITGAGKLTANGGKATGSGSSSYGIKCDGTLTISTSLNVAGGNAAGNSGMSVGVFGASVVIDGDDTVVTAIGNAGGWSSWGMSSSGSIRLNGGKVIASGVKKAIGSPFNTDPNNGKEIKYLVGSDTLTDYKDNRIAAATSLTVTLGDPAPVYKTIMFYTNGGKLTGTGVKEETQNKLYSMQYQKGVGIPALPRPTRDGYTFAGWYDRSNFAAGSGPIGSVGTGSGMNFTYYAKWLKNVAYVETAGNPLKSSYYTNLDEAISAAKEGDVVGLLANAQTVNIDKGSFILDLNGFTLNVLNVSGSANVKLTDAGWGNGTIGMISVGNGQIRSLCQEGYSLKIGGAWATDDQLSDSRLSGGVKIYALPFESVTASADKMTLNYGYTDSATLTADAQMASAPYYIGKTPTYQWYSVTGKGESRKEMPIAGAGNAEYEFPAGKGEGSYTYFCEVSYDGCAVRSNEVTVAVEKTGISGAVIHLGTQGTYNGTSQGVNITSVTLNGKTLKKDVDYEIVSGGTAINVENTALTIRGKGVYSGTASVNWSLLKANPSRSDFDFDQSAIDALTNGVEYTGKVIRIVAPTLKPGKTGMGEVYTLYKHSDVNLFYGSAKDAGTYSVMLNIKEGSNYKAKNLIVGTLTVKKAVYNGEKTKNVNVRYDKAHKDVAVALPTLPTGASYGDPVFSFAKQEDGTDCGYTLFPSGQRGVEGNTLYVTTDSVRNPGVYAEITIPVTGAKNYQDYEVTVRVTCIDRTVISFSGIEDNQSFVYDGTEKTPAGTLAVSDELSENFDVSSLEVQYEKVEQGTATPISGAPVNAGSYRVTYSVPDSNDQYKGSVTYSFTITKAQAPMLTEKHHSQKYTVITQQAISLADMGMPADAGTLTYAKGKVRHQNGNSTVVWDVNANGVVTYTITNGTVNECVTLSVIVSSSNYADASADIRITLIDLDAPAVSANPITVTYTGNAVSADTITGTAAFGKKDIPGTWSWAENQSRTNVSDSGEKTVVFTPADNVNYKLVETKLQLTINPAALTNVSVRQNGTLSYNGKPQQAAVETAATAVNNQPVTFTYCDSADGIFRTAVPSFINAGEYTVYYKATAPNHETATGSFKVNIARQSVAIPAADKTQFIYNGTDQTYTIALNDLYTVADNVKKNAGLHTVTVTLKDAGNYMWSDNTDEAKTYDFVIAKATVTVTVRDKNAYANSAAPNLSTPVLGRDYTVSGLIDNDTLTSAPTLTCDPAAPDLSKAGEAAKIKASGASAGDNYEIAYEDGKLIVSTFPFIGGCSTRRKG